MKHSCKYQFLILKQNMLTLVLTKTRISTLQRIVIVSNQTKCQHWDKIW